MVAMRVFVLRVRVCLRVVLLNVFVCLFPVCLFVLCKYHLVDKLCDCVCLYVNVCLCYVCVHCYAGV